MIFDLQFWISSENGPSAHEDSLTLALSQRAREGVRVFMVEGEA